MIKKTNQFEAKSEDGSNFIIIEYTEYRDVSDKKGRGFSPGLKHLETDSGDAVNRIEKGKYLIVGLNCIVTSDDPKAS